MKTTASLSALSALVLISASSAQVVSPTEFSTVEAPSYIYLPFGSNNSAGWRFAQIHDDLKGKKVTIREIGFRRDSTRSRFPSFEFTVTMKMSTAASTASQIVAAFDSNHGPNKSTVVLNKVIKFPGTSPNGVAAPWDYRIKLDNPYAFDGTQSGLCWEAQVSLFRNMKTTVYFDAAYSQSANPPLAQAYFGEGCVHSTQLNAAGLTSTSSTNYTQKTGTVTFYGSNQAPNSLAIGAIGFSRTMLGALPLPFAIPGSASAYSGTCTLYSSLDVLFAAGTDANGSCNASIPIPVDVNFDGAKLFVQLMSQDPQSNAALNLITTNAVEMQFVKPFGAASVSHVYASNTLSSTGSLQKTYGHVLAIF